jgi:hypothetical protein
MHFLKIYGFRPFRRKSVPKDQLIPTPLQGRTSRILSRGGGYIGHDDLKGEKRLIAKSISHIQLKCNVHLRLIHVIADMRKKTSFRVNGASANWRPSDTQVSTRVDTFNDAGATGRLELTQYKDEVTKNKYVLNVWELMVKLRPVKLKTRDADVNGKVIWFVVYWLDCPLLGYSNV